MANSRTISVRLTQFAAVFGLALSAAATDLPMVGARAEAQANNPNCVREWRIWQQATSNLSFLGALFEDEWTTYQDCKGVSRDVQRQKQEDAVLRELGGRGPAATLPGNR